MDIKKNKEQMCIDFYQDDNLYMKWQLTGEGLFVTVYDNEKSIVIKRRDQNDFCKKMDSIMKNDYLFQNPCSFLRRKEGILFFASDVVSDMENTESLYKTSCLYVQKKDDCYNFEIVNPHSGERLFGYHSVIFSANGSGYWTFNKDTHTSFQDDMIQMTKDFLEDQKVISKAKKNG